MKVLTKSMIERARDMGHDHGLNVGTWVIDGNTSDSFCRKVIEGYDDGDPEIMDMCPSPLSGEWADSPTVYSVLRELGVQFQNMSKRGDQLIDVYEEAFTQSYWDTVIQAAYSHLPEYEPCGVCGLYGHRVKEHDQ